MARGASRTPSKKTASRTTSASTSLPGWLKGAVCIAIGFGIAHYFFGDKDGSAPRAPTPPLTNSSAPMNAGKPSTTAPASSHPAQNGNASQNAQQQVPQKKDDQQSFDFYTILPSSEITPTSPVTSSSVQPSVPAPAHSATRPQMTATSTPSAPAQQQPVATTATSGDRYILQSLSTASQESANALAIKLRDLGVPTQVRAAQLANGKTTYRVQSGPFANGPERDRALGLIRVQHLNPVVMRVH